ncbi:MAG: hypothetical protein JW990_06880 [Thermoleophilia bacterium]|nr:hypothetical protein [Thermoleophilia bacterium]
MPPIADLLRVGAVTATREEVERGRAEYAKADTPAHQAVSAAYQALAEGRMVVSISRILREAGCRPDSWLPRIAIAPSGAREIQVVYELRGGNGVRTLFVPTGPAHGTGWEPGFGSWRYEHPVNDLFRRGPDLGPYRASAQARALVPEPPPRVRARLNPTFNLTLENYLTLWEAEWMDVQERWMVVAGDPAILMPLAAGSDVAVVLATWDLTPLEQAVLAGGS